MPGTWTAETDGSMSLTCTSWEEIKEELEAEPNLIRKIGRTGKLVVGSREWTKKELRKSHTSDPCVAWACGFLEGLLASEDMGTP